MLRRNEDFCPHAPRGSTARRGQRGVSGDPKIAIEAQLRAGLPGGRVDHKEHIPLAIRSDFQGKNALKEKKVWISSFLGTTWQHRSLHQPPTKTTCSRSLSSFCTLGTVADGSEPIQLRAPRNTLARAGSVSCSLWECSVDRASGPAKGRGWQATGPGRASAEGLLHLPASSSHPHTGHRSRRGFA